MNPANEGLPPTALQLKSDQAARALIQIAARDPRRGVVTDRLLASPYLVSTPLNAATVMESLARITAGITDTPETKAHSISERLAHEYAGGAGR